MAELLTTKPSRETRKCRWCGKALTDNRGGGIYRNPANGEPYAEHFNCRDQKKAVH